MSDTTVVSTPKPSKRARKSAPKVTGNWSPEDIDQLISKVESFPCIWNASISVGDKDRDRRAAAWTAVTDVFGDRFTTQQCSAKWQSLRATQRKSISEMKLKKSGDGASQKPRWRYFDAMAFVTTTESSNYTVSQSNMVSLFRFVLPFISSIKWKFFFVAATCYGLYC